MVVQRRKRREKEDGAASAVVVRGTSFSMLVCVLKRGRASFWICARKLRLAFLRARVCAGRVLFQT
jgi:hypothetical protein